MAEHIARVLYYFGIHLLYASAVWCGAWILTSTVRASATTKYWIWVATSLNFILPLGAVADKVWAEDLSWARPIGIIGDAGASIAQNTRLGVWLGSIWLVGATLMAIRLTLRLRADRRTAHATCQSINQVTSAILTHGVPVRFAAGRQGPAVDGVLRPRISLPRGIDGLLTKHELNAVLIHELTHARRRDNLIRLIHEIALCALWFHPLVWITGSRLALYRELSCDDSVIASARGRDLVSALAKLANPEAAFLLQATASSFLTHRLSRLTALPGRAPLAANAALALLFCVVLVTGIFSTVAHTACCFAPKLSTSQKGRAGGTCSRTHAIRAGVEGGIAGGISGSLDSGISGVDSGVSSGVSGGITGGTD